MKLTALFLGMLACAPAHAEDEAPQYTREETATIKKKLAGALDALGLPPQGYAKHQEEFNLASEPMKDEKGRVLTQNSSATRRLTAKAIKDAEKNMQDHSVEYQKKILAAQARGDYSEVMKLSQELQTKSAGTQMQVVEAQEKKMDPITIQVGLNPGNSWQIDPDKIIAESPGFIALKEPSADEMETKGRAILIVDPVKLKDTKKVSRAEARGPGLPAATNTSVFSVVVELDGPMQEIEAMAKKVDAKKLLALIDSK